MSETMSPTDPPHQLPSGGVRRVNNLPLYLIGVAAAIFLLIMALVAMDRSQIKQTAPDTAKRNGNASLFAKGTRRGAARTASLPASYSPPAEESGHQPRSPAPAPAAAGHAIPAVPGGYRAYPPAQTTTVRGRAEGQDQRAAAAGATPHPAGCGSVRSRPRIPTPSRVIKSGWRRFARPGWAAAGEGGDTGDEGEGGERTEEAPQRYRSPRGQGRRGQLAA